MPRKHTTRSGHTVSVDGQVNAELMLSIDGQRNEFWELNELCERLAGLGLSPQRIEELLSELWEEPSGILH